MSDTQVEWRTLYETKQVLFFEGEAVGDFYLAGDGIYRVRLWREDQVTGGKQRYVLTEDRARQTLLGMLERARREGGD